MQRLVTCTAPTDNSVSGAELLVSRGHVQPKSSPNSETRKDSTTRALRQNPILAPHRSIRTSKALTVIWSDSLSNPLLVPLFVKSVSIVTEVGMFQRNRIFVAWMAKAANLTLAKVR